MRVTDISFALPMPTASESLRDTGHFLYDNLDIVRQRIRTPRAPPWMPAEVESWLLSLTDSELVSCEANGLAAFTSNRTAVPAVIARLTRRACIAHACFPRAEGTTFAQQVGQTRRRSKRRMRPRKRAQVEAVAEIVRGILQQCPKTDRVVDVGAGHGHLAAHLAEALAPIGVPVRGIDRSAKFLEAAAALHGGAFNSPEFVLSDAVDAGIEVQQNDLLLGLHACGNLGDAIVQTAAQRRVSAVLLVSCCLQKLGAEQSFRQPLSSTATLDPLVETALSVPRDVLGLTNRSRGYISERDLTGRETRYALRGLLLDRGYRISRFGAEVEGISRHKLRKGILEVGSAALAVRGEYVNDHSGLDLERRSAQAKTALRAMRALTLPRAMLGECMEMAVVLDRAAHLEDAGFKEVRTFRIWNDSISVRNLAITAH